LRDFKVLSKAREARLASRGFGLADSNRLADFETLELRVPEIAVLNKVSSVDDYLAVHAAIVIPTTVPSAIVLSTDNDRSAFTVDTSKAAIVVAMADPHVDILCECGECNAQSHNRRNNKKLAPHLPISFPIYAATKADIYALNAAPSGKFQ
jgi:hypothetical protein